MTAIKQEDLIQSIADAFQYISYYHPLDYIKALGEAYEREESPPPRTPSRRSSPTPGWPPKGHRPICQDTGIGMVFIKVGMQVTWPDATMSIQQMIDEGVRRAYANPDNLLRASVLADPAGPAEHQGQHPGGGALRDRRGRPVEVICAAKGGGSEAKSKFAMLNLRRPGGLGPQEDPRDGRRLVPAGHHRHRHRRHPREGDAAGQRNPSWPRWTSTN